MGALPHGLLTGLDPFDIFDAEAARLDRHFSSLAEEGWNRPSRCAGWTVRDVLAHLAGQELYNHACLDGDLAGFAALLRREGVEGGFDAFNDWCVRQRRSLPVGRVLEEWRSANGQTRRRMRELGRDATLQTSAGAYPVGLQTFHYDSEYATHADDVGAAVAGHERDERLRWRVAVGAFVLAEQGSRAEVEPDEEAVRVRVPGVTTEMSPEAFVEATVGRLPGDDPLDPRVREALRCLA